tara:strand:+ start:10576 stop:11280 length:705 start_codon:yes stop_codon:yes gene_type:complete
LHQIFGVLALGIFTLFFTTAFADEPIKVTISNTLDNVKFDGEWSFKQEWKASSLDQFRHYGNDLILRTAHQDNYMYILIDVLGDITHDHMADRAIVCFDGQETSKMADDSDWCYVATRGSKNGHTLNGGSPIHRTSHFQLEKNHPDFIAIGGTSGENDRYLKTPHAAYEFRIPLEQIGLENEYGFFIQVFDGKNVMAYPNEHSGKYPQKIPSPERWGTMISPDNSISSEHFNQN